MPTVFGKTTKGAGTSSVFNNEIDSTFFTAPTSGLIVKFTAWCSNPDLVTLGFKVVCFNSSAGLPTTLVGESVELQLPTSAAATWRDLALVAPFSVVGGSVYHLGHYGVSGAFSTSIQIGNDVIGGSIGSFSTGTYPTVPATAVGAAADGNSYALFATYDESYIPSLGRRPVPMIQGPSLDRRGLR